MDVAVLERTLERERKRREQAERLLEEKSRALFYSYRELQNAQAELETNKSQLIQSGKMASLGEMAAGVAHEINNPVGFVSSNLNTLREYVDVFRSLVPLVEKQLSTPSAQTQAAINTLLKTRDVNYLLQDSFDLLSESLQGLDRVKEIVAGLKTFSRAGGDNHESVRLDQCLEEALPIVHAQLKHPCAIDVCINALPPVRGHSGRLRQVFLNLLVNATQAVQGRADPRVGLRADVIADAVEVHVCDNGCGISEEHIGKLFQPFFTTKPVGEGTGLGLSISHGIIEEHRGEIRCDSRLGEGTTFTVRLPLFGEEVLASPPPVPAR